MVVWLQHLSLVCTNDQLLTHNAIYVHAPNVLRRGLLWRDWYRRHMSLVCVDPSTDQPENSCNTTCHMEGSTVHMSDASVQGHRCLWYAMLDQVNKTKPPRAVTPGWSSMVVWLLSLPGNMSARTKRSSSTFQTTRSRLALSLSYKGMYRCTSHAGHAKTHPLWGLFKCSLHTNSRCLQGMCSMCCVMQNTQLISCTLVCINPMTWVYPRLLR